MFKFLEDKLITILHVDNFNHMSRQCLYFILFMNVVSSAMSTIFIPGFASAAADLNATHWYMQLTIVAHLFGEIFGRLLWGPLSDYIGNRNGLIPAVTLSIICQIGCCLSQSIEMLIIMRFIQAIGSGVVYVVSLNYIACNFDGVAKCKALSTLEMYQPIANLTAPIIGSILCVVGSWRFIFIFLVAMQMIIRLFLGIYMPNDKQTFCKAYFPLIFNDYRSLIVNKKFLIYSVIPGFVVGGYMVFSSNAHEIYQHFKISSDYAPHNSAFYIAAIQSIPLIFNIASTSLYRSAVQKFSLITARRIGAISNIIFILYVFFMIFNFIPLTILNLMLCMCIQCFGSAFIVPVSVLGAMENAREKACIPAATIVIFRNAIMSLCVMGGAITPDVESLLKWLFFLSITVSTLLLARRIIFKN